MSLLPPRESAAFIIQNADHVTVKDEGIKEVADIISSAYLSNEFSFKNWKKHQLNPKSMDTTAAEWIFFADTLNFSFWTQNWEKYHVIFDGKAYTGYWSLCAAINRALQEGVPILDPKYYANITLDELKHLFRTDCEIEMPLLEERLKVIQEAGHVLINKFGGSFLNCIALCEKSSLKLVDLLVKNFSSFQDETVFKNQKVAFYKRAQILVADLWSCFEGKGLGEFYDIDSITVFADYRVPQVLACFGALEYSSALLEKLNKNHMFQNGDAEEIEIRGGTIHACELAYQELKRRQKENSELGKMSINAILVDYYLWDYRRDHVAETDHVPFHKVRCIYY